MKTTLLSLLSLLSVSCVSQQATLEQLSNGSFMNTPEAPKSSFIYRTSYSQHIVTFGKIDGAGVITDERTISSGGDFPTNIVISPTKDLLLVSHVGAQTDLTSFRINPQNGELTRLHRNYLPNFAKIVFSSNGQYLYGLKYDYTKIFAYTVDHSTGVLGQIDEESLAFDMPAKDLVINSSGRFLFSFSQNKFNKFSIQADGKLSPFETTEMKSFSSMTVLRNGEVFAVKSNEAYHYKFNASGNRFEDNISYLNGSTYGKIQMSPNDSFAFVINTSSSSIESYSANVDGHLNFAHESFLSPEGCNPQDLKFLTPQTMIVKCHSGSNQKFLSLIVDDHGSMTVRPSPTVAGGLNQITDFEILKN